MSDMRRKHCPSSSPKINILIHTPYGACLPLGGYKNLYTSKYPLNDALEGPISLQMKG
jgi:hypothetical protein